MNLCQICVILLWVGVSCTFLAAGPVSPAMATARMVPDDYPSIRDAIDDSQAGDVILLADGVYAEFLNLYRKELTIKSMNGPDNCILTGTEYGVARIMEVMQIGVTLDGLTIQSIKPDPVNRVVEVEEAKIRVRNCRFQDNFIYGYDYGSGAALYVIDSEVIIENCSFTGNRTDSEPDNKGYALLISGSDLQMMNCAFTSNVTYSTCVVSYSDTVITDCHFTENESSGSHATFSILKSHVDITSCELINNSCDGLTGGISLSGTVQGKIGGSPEESNQFCGNIGFICSDLVCDDFPGQVFNASYNKFDTFTNDKAVSPRRLFDLTGSIYPGKPITEHVFISPGGCNSNDGLTPDTPFRTITHALEYLLTHSSENTIITLGKGTYSPAETGETYPLYIPDGVTLRGAGRDLTILDAEGTDQVIKAYNSDRTVIEDLTVTGGYSQYGAGIYLLSYASPIIRRCRITANTALYDGGGMCVSGYCQPRCHDCVFTANLAECGGGLYAHTGSGSMVNCRFEGNVSDAGGGCYLYSDHMIFLDCSIINNVAYNVGGGVYSSSGRSHINQCDISGNRSRRGGGLRYYSYNSSYSQFTQLNCSTVHNNTATEYGGGVAIYGAGLTLFNNLIHNNTSHGEGGGIDVRDEANPAIQFCTIAANTAEMGSGVSFTDKDCDGTMNACIVAHNKPDSIHLFETEPVITFSNIQGGFTGQGNLDADPLFVDLPGADFHLAQPATGFPYENPSVNWIQKPSIELLFEMFNNTLTMQDFSTRVDNYPDDGYLDIGYHYPLENHQLIPSVKIKMRTSYNPGQEFDIDILIYNPGETMFQMPVCTFLKHKDDLAFFPSWSPELDYTLMDIPPGMSEVPITRYIRFPDTGTNHTELCWTYSAILGRNLKGFHGGYGSFLWAF